MIIFILLNYLGLVLDFLFISVFEWLIYIFLKLMNIKDNNFPNIIEFYKCAYEYAIKSFKIRLSGIEEIFYD